jgi:DNA polymerase-4
MPGITVRVRFDLRSVTRPVAAPISATRALAEIAEDLVPSVLADHPAHAIVQLGLPPGA